METGDQRKYGYGGDGCKLNTASLFQQPFIHNQRQLSALFLHSPLTPSKTHPSRPYLLAQYLLTTVTTTADGSPAVTGARPARGVSSSSLPRAHGPSGNTGDPAVRSTRRQKRTSKCVGTARRLLRERRDWRRKPAAAPPVRSTLPSRRGCRPRVCACEVELPSIVLQTNIRSCACVSCPIYSVMFS